MDKPVNPIVITTSPFFMLPNCKSDLPPRVDAYQRALDAQTVYAAQPHCVERWGFVAEVVEMAQFAFGNFRDWAEFHVLHANLAETPYMFLMDTIRYIKTGQRRFPFFSIGASIEPAPGRQSSPAEKRQRAKELELALADLGDGSVILARWCSHPHGLEDLLRTAIIMFGGLKGR